MLEIQKFLKRNRDQDSVHRSQSKSKTVSARAVAPEAGNANSEVNIV